MRVLRRPGEVFGRLTIIERLSPRPCKNPIFLCRCECGNTTKVPGSGLAANGPKSVRSCGCAQRDSARRPQGQAAFSVLFARYVKNAEGRGLEFNITKDHAKYLMSQNCYYCGSAPRPYNPYLRSDGKIIQARTQPTVDRAWIMANGIDREDNTKGYTIENCVPACAICNYIKLDYTVAEFLSHSYKIVEFQENKKKKAA